MLIQPRHTLVSQPPMLAADAGRWRPYTLPPATGGESTNLRHISKVAVI